MPEGAPSRGFTGDLPSALGAYLEAAGRMAAAAAERGDLPAARRLLEEGMRAVEAADVRPGLRVIEGDVGGRR